tara:strand:+ start:2896 stop:3300 length:405 start_codon:yes stop_codon:yes gene_type:complete
MNFNTKLLQEAKELEARWDIQCLKDDWGFYRPIPKNIFWTQPKGSWTTIYRNHWLDRAEFKWRAKRNPGAIDAKEGILFGGHLACNCAIRLSNEENSDEFVDKAVLNYDKQSEAKSKKAKEEREHQKGTGPQAS